MTRYIYIYITDLYVSSTMKNYDGLDVFHRGLDVPCNQTTFESGTSQRNKICNNYIIIIMEGRDGGILDGRLAKRSHVPKVFALMINVLIFILFK